LPYTNLNSELKANDLKIIHVNSRSLYPNKIDNLRIMACNLKPTIICVSETWLNSSIPDIAVDILFYKIFRYDTEMNSGSVCIYVHEDLAAKLITVPDYKHTAGFDFIVLNVQYLKNKSFTVAAIYLHPPVTINIFQEFTKITHYLISLNKRMYLLGDFNINYLNKNNFLTKRLENFLYINKLKQVILEPTRCTDQTKTLIDLCIVNDPNINYAKSLGDNNIADHNTIIVSINAKAPKIINHVTKTFRTHKFYNKNNFNGELKQEITKNIKEIDDINLLLDNFNKTFLSVLDKAAPYVSRTFKNKTLFLPKEIFKLRKEKRFLRKSIKLCNYKSQNKDHVKELTKRIRKEIKLHKIQLIKNKIQNCGKNTQRLWKELNNITPFKNISNTFQIDLCNIETANRFNEHFSTVGEQTFNQLEKAMTHDLHIDTSVKSVLPKFTLQLTKRQEVTQTIKNLKNSSSMGIDNIKTLYLKDSVETITPFLTDIINKSISTNKVPDIWKTALVIPIYKKTGEKSNPQNYRPISLLPILSKIMEKIVSKQLTTHLENYKILHNTQYGFRNNSSTNNALNYVCNILYSTLDKKEIGLLVLIDLSKAFDSISHKILLKKLKFYNLYSDWFCDYLLNRKQHTKIGNFTSDIKQLNYGVPQGSILGPILFNLFANDMKEYAKQFKNETVKMEIVCYADDTQIIFTSQYRSYHELRNYAENILNKIIQWYTKYGLKINIKKTQCMLVGSKVQLNNIEVAQKYLILNKNKVDFVKSVTNLGVQFDTDMKFKSHIANLCKKVNSKLLYLNKTRKFHTFVTRKLLVENLAFSYLYYCHEVWGLLNQNQTSKIQRLINFGAKIIFCKNKFDHASELIKQLKWFNATQLTNYFVGCYIYKEVKELFNKNIQKALTIEEGIATRGMYNKFQISNTNTQYGKFNLEYRAIILWNTIPQNLKNINNFKTFKNEFRVYLLEGE